MRISDDPRVDLDRARARVAARRGGLEADFSRRLDEHFGVLHGIFRELYGHRDDSLDQLLALVGDTAASWFERTSELRALDAERERHPDWFQSNRMLGGVCYVDRFADTLAGIREQLPYFRELGLNYLHLMPLFASPEGNSDGGYAVSSYRDVDPKLGTMAELAELARAMRAQGISPVIDFVFNHTSNEHEWARRAVAGDAAFRDFYFIFPDRELPDRYEQHVREIFPDDHPGAFVPLPDGRWIWATFHSFQWDLNYANPAVFRAMAGELLFLANQGIEIIRMDAVAFIWKRLGTSCESLPEGHLLLRAYNALMRIAAPAVLFKSEAIVHPAEVARYIAPEECQLSYNPLQMALGWEALATRDPRLLAQALERWHDIPDGAAWVNYVRGHDDIGWTFSDEDAAELGIDPAAHRRWLNDFYVNRVDGSFARGVPFQDNPATGDCRISGTTASLAGVEARQSAGLERALLLHSIALSTGGIPVIYLGDEVAQLNDYRELEVPEQAADSRWVHRPHRPAARYELRGDERTVPGWMFSRLCHLIEVRTATPEFAGNRLLGFDAHHPSVLGYQRPGSESVVLVLVNFGDEPAEVSALTLSGFAPDAVELVTGARLELGEGLTVPPCRFVWLRVRPRGEAAG